VHAGDVDGIALCCMFNSAIADKGLPKRLSSDNVLIASGFSMFRSEGIVQKLKAA
jgi:hypothetical protein